MAPALASRADQASPASRSIPSQALDASAPATSHASGGILSMQDFADYSVTWDAPIRCDYRGYTIVSAPPPSSGGTTICELHPQWLPDVVLVEPGLPALRVQSRLEAIGHHFKTIKSWGADEAILVSPKTGLLEGANDRRRPAGLAAGY